MAALNISPIRPLSNSGGGFSSPGGFGNMKPISSNLNSLSRIKPSSDRAKTAFEKIDIGKIGKGYLLVEGAYEKQFGREKYSGLKGQLMSMRKAGKRSVTKNLSKENVKQMYDLISGRLKNKAIGSANYISREDRLEIMKEARKLTVTEGSGFTRQDRKDLLKTVDALREQSRNRVLNRDSSELDSPIDELEPPTGVFQPNSSEHSTGVFEHPSSKSPEPPDDLKMAA